MTQILYLVVTAVPAEQTNRNTGNETKIWDAQFDEVFSRFTPTKVKGPGHKTKVKWEKFNAIKMLKISSSMFDSSFFLKQMLQ